MQFVMIILIFKLSVAEKNSKVLWKEATAAMTALVYFFT
jgi:hypothetical protein